MHASLADPDRRGRMAANTAAELAGTDETATDLVRRVFDRTEGAFRALIEEGHALIDSLPRSSGLRACA